MRVLRRSGFFRERQTAADEFAVAVIFFATKCTGFHNTYFETAILTEIVITLFHFMTGWHERLLLVGWLHHRVPWWD